MRLEPAAPSRPLVLMQFPPAQKQALGIALARYTDGMTLSRYAQPSFSPTEDLSMGYVSWEGKKEEKGMTSMWFFRSCPR